jgi:hypothetical protein
LGVTVDPERTRAILEFPAPTDVKGVSRFVGMTNFYQKFIPKFADIAKPLNGLRKKGAQFEWGKDQDRAFKQLKTAISQPPVLAMVDFSKTFILQTDASGVGVAAVLLQEQDGVRRPIAYASHADRARKERCVHL